MKVNGFLNLYKPAGVSSAHILNAVKKSVRGVSVGHMGTLDPLASGVLPVAFGKSTRLFDFLLDKEKIYVARFAFGYSTDTLDLEGKAEERTEVIPTEEEILEVLPSFCGEISQIPPVFSAKCVNGKRSYELARKGQAVDLPAKKVFIEYVKILKKTEKNEYEFEIKCKGGTYIRSIARDLGKACGSLATMTSLVRTKSGIFDVKDSVTAETFVNASDKNSLLIKPENVVDYPVIKLTEKESERLFNGLYDVFDVNDGIYRIFTPDSFYGVGIATGGKIKVKAYLRDD